MRFAAVLESLLDVDQLFRRQHAIGQVARFVGGGIGVLKSELVAGEAARMRLRLGRPVGDRRLVQHVASARHDRRRAPCRGTCRRAASTSAPRGSFPPDPTSAISMPLTARIRLCAEPSVRVPLKLRRAFAHLRVELVDLQWIFADQPRLERQHLLLHADAGRAVGLGDAVQPGIRRDLDEGVGAAGPLHQHHLHVANLHALPLGGGELVKRRQERGTIGAAHAKRPRNSPLGQTTALSRSVVRSVRPRLRPGTLPAVWASASPDRLPIQLQPDLHLPRACWPGC